MKKEIGSNFWLNRYEKLKGRQIDLDYLDVDIKDVAYLSTGRSAISYILDHINTNENKRVALLPAFTCHTVIQPFIDSGYEVFYYNINRNLSYNEQSFLEAIKEYKPSVVILHSYFGFNTLNEIKDIILDIKQKGTIVIEDITQSMYSEFEHISADYYMGSFRKWTALPDGAFAINTNKLFSYKPCKSDDTLQEIKLKAFHQKYLYMEKYKDDKEDFIKLFYDSEQVLCKQKGLYAMGSVSRKLQSNLDISNLKEKRRDNFKVLIEGLRNNNIVEPVFRKLLIEVTPLYFPVYVKCNVKDLQAHLASSNIYAPVIWPKPIQCNDSINIETEWIYGNILSIPCDQRYNSNDMNRIIKVIRNYNVI